MNYFTGDVFESAPKEGLYRHFSLNAGKLDGHYKEWYLNGKRKLSFLLRNGQCQRFRKWDEKGVCQLDFKGERCIEYHDSGKFKQVSELSQNQTMIVTCYDKDGVQKFSKTIQNQLLFLSKVEEVITNVKNSVKM